MTTAFIYSMSAVFGLLFGSFANVAVLRDGDWKGILVGHSRCPDCKHSLSAFDLVPALSFAFLRGRCHYCHKAISWQYPVVEVCGAGLAVLSAWYGWIGQGNAGLAVSVFLNLLFLLVIAVEDIRSQEVSLPYCVLAGVFGGAGAWLSGALPLIVVVEGIVAGAGIILLISGLWKLTTGTDGMGSGDAWIAGAVGALVGWPLILIAFGTAVMSGAALGLVLYGRGPSGLKTRLAFGPFLAFGALIAMIWGQTILRWYII